MKTISFFYSLNRLSYFNMLLYVIFDLYTVNKRYKIPKGQSKKDNREKLATQNTQDEEKQYVLDTNIRKQTQITYI